MQQVRNWNLLQVKISMKKTVSWRFLPKKVPISQMLHVGLSGFFCIFFNVLRIFLMFYKVSLFKIFICTHCVRKDGTVKKTPI